MTNTDAAVIMSRLAAIQASLNGATGILLFIALAVGVIVGVLIGFSLARRSDHGRSRIPFRS